MTARHARIATRSRLRAVAAGAGFAFIVGLSGPMAAYAADTTGTPTEVPVAEAAIAAPADVPAAAEAVAAQEPVAVAAPAPVAPAAPTEADMHPVGLVGEQQRFTPTAEQMTNARAIVETGKAMGLPPRAWVIAVGTSLQETNLKNLGHLGERNDHDSQGLFQQRPSSGWGTVEEITNPTYAATAFYKGLVDVAGWDTLPLTAAAQKVQISAYPDHYAKHESEAGDIVRGLHGEGPFAGIA